MYFPPLCRGVLELCLKIRWPLQVVLTQLKKGAFFGELAVMFVILASFLVGWPDQDDQDDQVRRTNEKL